MLHLLVYVAFAAAVAPHFKTFHCTPTGCQPLAIGDMSGQAREVCALTCGGGSLWPLPTGPMSVRPGVITGIGENISFDYAHTGPAAGLLRGAVQEFLDVVTRHHAGSSPNVLEVSFSIAATTAPSLTLQTDESYKLAVRPCSCGGATPCMQVNDGACSSKVGGICSAGTRDCENAQVSALITAPTFYGARHGLETLSQLIHYDHIHLKSLVVASGVSIEDKPHFPYRGVLVDTGRHFLPLDTLKSVIRALGYNKMNTLHIHLSDTASFPFELTRRPNVTQYGAYGPDMYYSITDIAELMALAAVTGVRVIPEIDSPAHAAEGWQWGEAAGLGELVLCTKSWSNSALEPPSGQMNIVNDHLYEVLGDIYKDVIAAFPTDIYHLGGDEVVVGDDTTWAACWNSTTRGKAIIDYLEMQGMPRGDPESFYKLWQNFTLRAKDKVLEAYQGAPKPLSKILQWGGAETAPSKITYNLIDRDDVTSILDPKLFAIQVWDNVKGSLVPGLLKKGYEVVMSHTDYVYLDCGGPGWAHAGGYWCTPYHEWYKIYDYIPDALKEWNMTSSKGILGAETLMWGEEADEYNLEPKLWPRTAALGERLWTNPTGGWFEADPRMQQQRQRLVERGIRASALQPHWCLQHGGHSCTLNSGKPQASHRSKQ